MADEKDQQFHGLFFEFYAAAVATEFVATEVELDAGDRRWFAWHLILNRRLFARIQKLTPIYKR